MKLTSWTLVFLLSGFLSSFCWAIPTSAAVGPDFYWQQIGISYSAEDDQRSISYLNGSEPVTRPRDTFNQQAFGVQKREEEVLLEEKRDRLQSPSIQPPMSVSPSTIIAPGTPPGTPPGELVQPAPVYEVLSKPDIVPQKSRRILITPRTAPRIDPYRLIAVKRTHSHSIGHNTAFRERGTSSITAQLPKQLSQINAQLSSTIRQQPERFQTMLGNGRSKLQQLSSQQLELRGRDLQIFVEDVVKQPLRHVFKKIESLSHKAAKRLG